MTAVRSTTSATVIAPGAPDATQVLTFRLDDDLFAADIHDVERVLRWQSPTPMPNVPPWIAGVVDYHRRVVPVIDLRLRFEVPAGPVTPETRIVVFNAGTGWIAGIVDAVLDVSALDRAALEPPPPLFRGVSADYLQGIVRRQGSLVILLRTAELLSATDRLTLARALGTAGDV
jgi:purine-binding chemotaxis protein CheW